MSGWVGRMTVDEDLLKPIEHNHADNGCCGRLELRREPGDFYLKIYCYLQATAIIGLALALWFSAMNRSQAIERMQTAIDTNNSMIYELKMVVADQQASQERWQSQALAQIRKAVESGQW